MTITIIIIGLLVFVTRSAFDTLSQGNGNVSSYQKANIALEQLATDLESLVVREGNNFEWLVAERGGGDAVANGYNAFATNLAFFTVAADRYDGDVVGNSGDVACVHYGLGFIDPVGTGDQKLILYRNIFKPGRQSDTDTETNTFDNLMGTGNQEDLLGTIEDLPQSRSENVLQAVDNIVTDSIRELTVSFTVEYSQINAETGLVATNVAKIPVISTNANNVSDFTIRGDGLIAPAAASAASIRDGRVISIDINAQVIAEDTEGLLNLGTVPTEKVEKEITRFSKTISIPQLN